jgi:hypothetical protein
MGEEYQEAACELSTGGFFVLHSEPPLPGFWNLTTYVTKL